MQINFKSLHIHHLLSFDDATIDLNNRGYCLIKGINKNPKDAAKSNGAGKSTIANAIAFCLLGETLSGLKSNLANNYFNDGCYVELEFEIDNHKYKLLRSKDDTTYGTNLKIVVDSEDKSGKGIRESQAILDELLPDLTRELVGSVILLGQGLPDKFTSNSPSGRKEVLEHLSKSDFMIQDLKERVDARYSVLESKTREYQDLKLKIDTKKSLYEKSLKEEKDKYEKLSVTVDYDSVIKDKEKLLKEAKEKYTLEESKTKDIQDKKSKLNESLLEQKNLKSERLSKVFQQFTAYDKELSIKEADLNTKIITLTNEINKLKSITDICPTCGQKIPGAVKPDTSKQEEELKTLKENLNNVLEEEKANNEDYNKVKEDIETLFIESTKDINSQLSMVNSMTLCDLQMLLDNVQTLNTELTSIIKDKELHQSKLNECNKNIETYATELFELESDYKDCVNNILDIQKHSEVINKMSTYLKRDFRGVLLQNSINYINNKAKEYSSKIFNTDEIRFELNGNNIDITYCKKDYDNLSGGEKQRVDLITQFAIRDMLSKHLNFSSNILFLDEITDNLDSDSCDRVMNFITDELKDIESVFIISHHDSELQLPIDNEIVVQKNILGVSEVI